MKKIGIDARLYSQTGVGTYLRNLIHWLPKFLPNSSNIILYVLPSEEKRITLHDPRFALRKIEAPWHSMSEQTSFYKVLMQDKLDLMHFPYFGYPIRYNRPFIVTIHDLTPLLFKTGRASTLNPILYELKYQIFKFVLSSQIRKSRAIITPSKAVKNQILDIYGQNLENKIHPIYEGVNYELIDARANIFLRKEYSTPYFLYVGNFYPHKNVASLIEAYKIYCHSRKNEQTKYPVGLILLGPDNMFAAHLKKKIEQEKIEGTRFVHFSNTEDLVYFYKNAKALVNPSFSEGFGLPLLEASYFGCPVIASDLPVFHEILGDHYIAFDPKNVEDIAEKLKIKNFKIKNNTALIEKKFSFEKMVKETVALYRSLL